MNLHDFNTMDREELKKVLFNCCGSSAWVEKMMQFIPAEDFVELLEDAEEQWWLCSEKDWKEAFSSHPRIGDLESLKKKFATTAAWAAEEQGGVNSASEETLKTFAALNNEYEDKFGYIFIVCASGKSAEEMLSMLQRRLQNSPEVEIEVAADEQNAITKLRLEKLLEV
jgi:2-oxo-4-hydroxy-4-carboxy-5-ureidoimidazoline decarboxylase